MLDAEKNIFYNLKFVFRYIVNFKGNIYYSRFDLARLDMDHLREIYMDYPKTAIAIPLYLLTFSFHQASLKIDDQLALIHYRNINETMWPNVSIAMT